MPAHLLLAAVLFTPCTPPSRPWVAEVFYDAAGDDTGHEFVELLNGGTEPHPLAGLRLEAGDGSGAGRWTTRWTGGPGDTIGPGARFVIGGALVRPPADAVVTLDLQNGPDAVRLVWPDGAVEVVGYGDHELAEYACGDPAPDAAAGQSLARTPDDSNAGSNRLDFRAARPSPRSPNVSSRNVAIAPGSLRVEPEGARPGEPLALSGGVVNPGREPAEAGSVEVRAEAAREDGSREPLGATALDGGLTPGDSAGFAIATIAPAEGKLRVVVTVRLPGDQDPRDDSDSVLVRIGAGPLSLTEIQFHPSSGEGEWVEVRNASTTALDPAAFAIADQGGTSGRPEAGRAPLAAESLAVLAQDRRALLARFPGLDSARVWETRPWPSLNNRDGEQGVADRVMLRESDGALSDQHAYSSAGLPDGLTLERRDGDWWPGRVTGGSPLAPPVPFAAPAGRFAIEPRLLDAIAPRARCRWALPWPRARVRLEILDLAGRTLPGGIPEFPAPATGELEVSFALPPGLYAIALRARPEVGTSEIVELRAIRVIGGAP